MPQSLQTRVAFDALIITVVAPELKRRGYRKSGLRWNRSRDKIKATIRVRRDARDRWLDEVRFTFDFEVRTADVVLDGRIGALMPEPDDVWWQVHNGVLSRKTTLAPLEPELVEHEIADALSRVGEAIDLLGSATALREFADQHADVVELGLLRAS